MQNSEIDMSEIFKLEKAVWSFSGIELFQNSLHQVKIKTLKLVFGYTV